MAKELIEMEVVNAEVRGFVYSIVTALGGSANDEAGRYILGDDALGCLRDLKKWLRFYDDKMNRLDVARCLAETNLVNGDILPILALWDESEQSDKHKSRIILACLELLVPLTWPAEIHSEMTVNHHKHTPYLQRAQVAYKRGILSHLSKSILRTIIRSGIPSITTPRSERSTRDEGILKLVLYFFRNIVIINETPNNAIEGDEDQSSRSATICAFHDQDVFALLLTICSNVEAEFSLQDTIILEILFHLVKGVDVKQVFMDVTQLKASRSDELQGLINAEESFDRSRLKNAPTRHGRFGTMIWVKRDGNKRSTVSGQDVLKDDQLTYMKMDKTKKWNKPKKGKDVDVSSNNLDVRVSLSSSALHNLRIFVEEFLDSGFNPLFASMRKAIEREAERVTEPTTRQFFFVASWFLSAERARRALQEENRKRAVGTIREIEPDSFSLVASVLNQETFIALHRFMQSSADYKEWQDLGAGMLCFTQILLTVQEMSKSRLEEDQEIAENIQNRLFYEESTHDRVLSVLRNYKDQGFWYLNACTELSHVFLRMLERYSKQNVDMQIKSKRRTNQKKSQAAQPEGTQHEAGTGEAQDSEEEEEKAEAARNVKERSFDFKKFANRFCTQASVNTFIDFLSYYRDLDLDQLKRAHRFFYRVAFKQELSILLFRLDIISMFQKMIKGADRLDPSNKTFPDWEELVRQLFKKLIRKLVERPQLATELLFSKIPATLNYLEYGYEKQTLKTSKPAMELEVKPTAAIDSEGMLRVVVSALVQANNEPLVRWVCGIIENAVKERKSWELAAEARLVTAGEETLQNPEISDMPPSIEITPLDEKRRTAMYRNGRFRLLLNLSGFELGGEDVFGVSWIIPPTISAVALQETQNLIQKYCDNPIPEIDGVQPHKLIRRKRMVGKSVEENEQLNVDFGSGSEGEDVVFDDSLFPPNPRSKSNAKKQLKQKRRKRQTNDDGEDTGLDEEALRARQLAREKNAVARQKKIKSALYVNASDDESDAEADREFFAREETRRKTQAKLVTEAMSGVVSGAEPKGSRKKRKQTVDTGDEDDEVDDDDGQKKRLRSESETSDDDSDDDLMGGIQSTAISATRNDNHDPNSLSPSSTIEDDLIFDAGERSPTPSVFQWTSTIANGTSNPQAMSKTDNAYNANDDDDDEPVAPSRRTKIMAGFMVDSDSE